MQRIASLLNRYPDCCEKLGVLIRLFRDISMHKSRNSDVDPAHELRVENAEDQQDIGEKESCQKQREAQAKPVGRVQICKLCDTTSMLDFCFGVRRLLLRYATARVTVSQKRGELCLLPLF